MKAVKKFGDKEEINKALGKGDIAPPTEGLMVPVSADKQTEKSGNSFTSLIKELQDQEAGYIAPGASPNDENVMSKKRQNTAKKIIAAIKESKGLLTLAARKAGISYITVWRYTQDFPSVKQAVEEAKETMTDFAEGKLFEKISKGDITAIIFYLKTKGKSRGYIERHEVGGEGNQPITIKVVYDNSGKA